jgi:hypothetical protein
MENHKLDFTTNWISEWWIVTFKRDPDVDEMDKLTFFLMGAEDLTPDKHIFRKRQDLGKAIYIYNMYIYIINIHI